MRFAGILAAVAVAMFAQEQPPNPPPLATATQKAPARVDKALRSRINFFFQAHVDGKWRLADQVVAGDSKDLFFAIQKPRFLSFEIAKIEYSDNFQRAKVTVNCEEDMLMMGAGSVRLKMPRFSDWKLEHGKWFWWVDQNAIRDTPFGPMKPLVKAAPGDQSPPTPLVLPKGPSPKDIQTAVKADKMEVSLKAAEPSSDTVTVSNGMPGWITLRLVVPPVPGLEVTLDRTDVGYGQQAHVTFRYAPNGGAAPPPTVVNVNVEPTRVRIPVRVTFQAPAPAADKPPQ